MRKSREAAAETRERIVATAAAEFRRNGIGGTGLAGLMAAAGLTHGGFYRHFEAKDTLVAEACALASTALSATLAAASARRSGRAAFKAAVASYLSPQHRDHPAAGCPFVALGSELARASEPVRETAAAGFMALVDALAAQLDDRQPAAARKEAMAAMCTMVGALTMARIVPDAALSAEILANARQHCAP
jgi:TetR/AcrR family transcriptional repressor of nem operon